MQSSSRRPRATRRGVRLLPGDGRNTAPACCSRRRGSSTTCGWSRSIPKQRTAFRSIPRSTCATATDSSCPMEQTISEFHMVKAPGEPLAALGIIAVDNPMLAATGHRICNDCMKACIYQKQDPVDIPQVETRTLKDVLDLPWGFEIYALLTRWNPLDLRRPLPKEPTGRTVLVVGLGPAGFTLAHHLMNDGHAVVAVDGLKIEPLDADVSGVDVAGTRTRFRPIHDA